jgi:enterochelin esterase family protein
MRTHGRDRQRGDRRRSQEPQEHRGHCLPDSGREKGARSYAGAIDIRIAYPDPQRRLARVRLAHQLGDRLPRDLRRNGRTWTLTAPRPDVARFEYLLELVTRGGDTTWALDPSSPHRAGGPWGEKSVWEEPGYRSPAWLGAGPVGDVRQTAFRSRILRAEVPALLWCHPDAGPGAPLLVVHDGPEYAEHSSLLTLLGTLPPLRAALLGPVERNEIYSASARYTRALVDEILPALGDAPVRVGLGASLGALALFHAHRRRPEALDALCLQSGSFFRRADAHERWFPRYERIARFVGGVTRGATERPIPVALACGTVEENLPANRALAEALDRQGYEVELRTFRDGHNWVAWRDAFQPQLGRLLERVAA